jgi:ubiquitin C-terminal hydrolase
VCHPSYKSIWHVFVLVLFSIFILGEESKAKSRSKRENARVQQAFITSDEQKDIRDRAKRRISYLESNFDEVFSTDAWSDIRLRGTPRSLGRWRDLEPNADWGYLLGLQNVGNTCFANSVHKLLFAHPEIEAFTSKQFSLNPHNKDGKSLKLRERLKKALHRLMVGLGDRRRVGLSESIDFDWIGSNHFRQELHAIFDSFEDLLSIVNSDGEHYFAKEGKLKNYLRRDHLDANEYLARLLDNLDYERYFGGFKEASILTFESGLQRLSAESDHIHTMMQLPISNPGVASVQDAIKSYFSVEEMSGDNQLYNEATKQNENGSKQLVLLKNNDAVPDNLIVNLRRFEFDYNTFTRIKLNHSVEISEEIELEYLDKSSIDSDSLGIDKKRMRPLAVIVHHGFANAGHYLAYLYDDDRRTWFKHDDTHVRELNSREVGEAKRDMSENGYIILYSAKGIIQD